MFTFPPFPRRPAPARPWSPLADAEWAALSPYLRAPGPGRPIQDLRARLDGIFRAVTTRGLRWNAHASPYGRADTLHRHFRRLAHAGVWTALLKRVAKSRCPRPLRAIRDWLCAAHRRAVRVIGLSAIVLARRLNLPRALPGPSWLLPDPDLSETLRRVQVSLIHRRNEPDAPALMRLVGRIIARISRARPIGRYLEPR